MSMNLPLSLLQYQGPMLKTLGSIALSSVLPKKRMKRNPEHIDDVHVVLPTPPPDLVNLYRRWCTYSVLTENGNAPLESNQELPPHLFSQFALSICAKQLKQTRYKLSNILNQGVGLTVHHPIPMGEALHVTCKMLEIKEENNRARLHQELHIGTQNNPHCYTASFHTLFILGKSKKDKRHSPSIEGYRRVGKWIVAPNDGLNFALLTGDLNPIHWISFVAKMSPFKRKVLHGFGMFTRTIETLQASEAEPIKSINVRFISPAFLNGQLVSVMLSEAKKEGERHLALIDQNGKALMLGSVEI
ncbi:MaoC/PaaZ C-terminal domain-containing protein [Alteromonas sp. a30]|uniref:MaoC/PaaZ C-terminal domain-containing protein n=1 Tax=Alteromonas sp. a30 TaxID=2730917 RepID=UPI00227E0E01|nr:MaoC/PaaZ C-terminal domain-containing protein [Alteromonas sp. a30]MCY7296958.1 hypothetical protein [Alteromonas sp. a30]